MSLAVEHLHLQTAIDQIWSNQNTIQIQTEVSAPDHMQQSIIHLSTIFSDVIDQESVLCPLIFMKNNLSGHILYSFSFFIS